MAHNSMLLLTGRVPIDSYRSQKMQAVLLTLAANAIVDGKKRTDYWQAEKTGLTENF
jgi:hypothetical protein